MSSQRTLGTGSSSWRWILAEARARKGRRLNCSYQRFLRLTPGSGRPSESRAASAPKSRNRKKSARAGPLRRSRNDTAAMQTSDRMAKSHRAASNTSFGTLRCLIPLSTLRNGKHRPFPCPVIVRPKGPWNSLRTTPVEAVQTEGRDTYAGVARGGCRSCASGSSRCGRAGQCRSTGRASNAQFRDPCNTAVQFSTAGAGWNGR